MSDNYNVRVLDQSGYDVLEGAGLLRDTATTEQASIKYASTSLHPAVDESDTLTLAITQNNAPGAILTVDLYYALGY